MKFALAYSGGKDSILALNRMVKQGHMPVAFITTINIEKERSWFHGIQNNMLIAASDSLRIPIIFSESSPDSYTQVFEKSLAQVKEKGADSCVFGDIDIAGHKEWNEERCKNAGLNCIMPLWGQERASLVNELIEEGFRALIKIVDCSKLDESFLGQDLTPPLIKKIKKTGADVCGENGEYHTFVYDGPLFSYPVSFDVGDIIDFGTHKAIDIKLSETNTQPHYPKP